MTYIAQFGEMPSSPPEGNFRRVRFDQAAMLDTPTEEGWIRRTLASGEGAGVRELPRTLSLQYVDDQGHLRSVPAGSIWQAKFDSDTKKLSLWGWLADTDDGRLAERVIVSKALRHNSVDLADIPPDGVTIEEHGDFFDDDFWLEVKFNTYNVAKTTLVATPAFKNAAVEIDEILASFTDETELVIDCPSYVTSNSALEIMASMSTRPSWDYFNRPEADIPHPIVVDEPDANGWIPIYGNLAQWRKQHRDSMGVLRHPPRGYDNYANFMKPKAILTDNGFVAAGPITLLGGHVSFRDAVNNIENIWADVKIVDGKHGPWICGVMRPHIAADEIATYRARAAQISGYWSGGVLRLISAVTTPGYPITEHESEDALVAAFSPEPEQGRGRFPIEELTSFDEISPDAQQRIMAWVQAGSKGSQATLSIDTTNGFGDTFTVTETTTTEIETDTPDKDDDFAFRQRQRARELALAAETV